MFYARLYAGKQEEARCRRRRRRRFRSLSPIISVKHFSSRAASRCRSTNTK